MYSEEVKKRKKGKGILIAFEGIDCAGKTSVLKVLPDLLAESVVPLLITGELKSPLALLLKDSDLRTLSPFLKTYFFAADRAWTYERECLPILEKGGIVLWDRYVDSAIVYRMAELVNCESIINLQFVEEINSPFIAPDLIFFINICVKTSISREIESESVGVYSSNFLSEVQKIYLDMASKKDYIIINGERDIQSIALEIALIIQKKFGEKFK